MSIESFKSNCNFYDTIHFRHGFARSGMFTRREADILSQCGYVIRQLEKHEIEPTNGDHKSMLNMLQGLSEPCNEVEKAWAKYLTTINIKVRKFSGFASRSDDSDTSITDWDGSL